MLTWDLGAATKGPPSLGVSVSLRSLCGYTEKLQKPQCHVWEALQPVPSLGSPLLGHSHPLQL